MNCRRFNLSKRAKKCPAHSALRACAARRSTGKHIDGRWDRRGSTVVVVLALLGSLALMGFLIYTLAAQEEVNAEYFADSHKEPQSQGLNPDLLFDFTLRQIIMGADHDEVHSALWGGRKSLMATLYGRDMHPFSGMGVNVASQLDGFGNPTGEPMIDQDYNDFADADQVTLLEVNDSPAAQGVLIDLVDRPEPDVDFTYPDINNSFLAYRGFAPDGSLVIVPSYHRPQLLRSGGFIVDWHTNAATSRRILRPHPLHTNSDGSFRYFGPDGAPGDVGVDDDGINGVDDAGEAGFPGTDDFPFTGDPAGSIDDGVWNPASLPANLNYDVDADGDGVKEAVYVDIDFPMLETPDGLTQFVPLAAITIYDADALLNLNAHGNQENIPQNFDLTQGTAGSFGGGYISASNHGLLPAEVNPEWALFSLPDATDISGPLNTALKQHLLFFNRVDAAGLPDATKIDAANSIELANMEWWFLTAGRPELEPVDATEQIVSELISGRWGERERLQRGTNFFNSSGQRLSHHFSLAGVTHEDLNFNGVLDSGEDLNGNDALDFGDDNLNALESGIFANDNPQEASIFPAALSFPAFERPLDFFASSSFVEAGTNGKTRTMRNVDVLDPLLWPRYDLYAVNPALGWVNSPLSVQLMPSWQVGFLFDEAGEIVLEPSLADTSDKVFGADQNAALHLTDSDRSAIGLSGRVIDLAPINFQVSNRAETIRRQFTTSSWDVKSYAKTFYPSWPVWVASTAYSIGAVVVPTVPNGFSYVCTTAGTSGLAEPAWPTTIGGTVNDNGVIWTAQPDAYRPWEFTGGSFPPTFAAPDPFRPELRELLQLTPADTTTTKPQRRLSINGVLDRRTDGRLYFRPLTPHPGEYDRNGNGALDPDEDLNEDGSRDVLGTATIPTAPPPLNQITTLAQQEAWARRDRQLMARDIYVLLYTLGGGNDTKNYATDPVPYTPEQLEQMAQLAANWVDALDPDDHITIFEYDTNLSNGWNIDDNPYLDEGGDRKVVYGVEAQTFALSEALLLRTAIFENTGMVPQDHDATQYNDTEVRYFTYIELRNMSPFAASFDNGAPDDTPGTNDPKDNGVWQLEVELDNTAGGGVITRRQLTVRADGATPVPPGELFTILTAGDDHNKDSGGITLPSYVMMDFVYEQGIDPVPNPEDYPDRVLPSALPTRSLDLVTAHDAAATTFLLTDPDADPSAHLAVGSLLNSVNVPADVSNAKVIFRLRRRADIHRQAPATNFDAAYELDNPWVEVDSMEIRLTDGLVELALDPADTEDGVDVKEQLWRDEIRSHERTEPLNRNVEPPYKAFTPAGPPFSEDEFAGDPDTVDWATVPKHQVILNSFGTHNSASLLTNDSFDLWQPGFNRDFASVAELFGVPRYGPAALTEDLALTDDLIGGTSPWFNRESIAGHVFLDPESPIAQVADVAGDPEFDNRWHRVLSLVEVPDRTPAFTNPDTKETNPWFAYDAGGIGAEPLGFYRTPGKINLNTVRHPSVLAGVLDDRDVIGFDALADPISLIDIAGEAARDWWKQLLQARDGVSSPTEIPLTDAVTGKFLPGVPGTRPFRSLGFSLQNNFSLEHSLLRSLPIDLQTGTPVPRRLFEIGDSTPYEDINYNGLLDGGEDFDGDTLLDRGDPLVDYTTQHRLLGKVLNNSTNRSNVFLIFIQIDFFEAAEVFGPGPDGQPGVAGVDDDGINGVDDVGELGTSGSDDVRTVRIGQKLPDSPGFRGFFVVDRTKAPPLLKQPHLPKYTVGLDGEPGDATVDDDGVNGVDDVGELGWPGTDDVFIFSFDQNETKSFDWGSLVVHRQRIR